MRKVLIAFILFISVSLFQFCSSSKKAAATVVPVNYEANVLPLIQSTCAPCHIAGKGKKASLDNFVAASKFADEIIERIQKNPTEHGFMPMRNAKLSDSAILVFVNWKKDGLKEK